MKRCSKCERYLDRDKFSPASGGSYLRPECRECASELSKRAKELKQIYGVPPTGYVCPICLKTEKELRGVGGNAGVWVIDHDHHTDTFRGFLCHNCNRGIGIFQDDVERLKRAIKYLS